MKLENERLCVEISAEGAELTRIYDKKRGYELLWEADPAYWVRHSPILFPNVGKTYRNTVRISGTQYPTSQHGFARDNEFRCVNAKETQASFLFISNDETKEVYPYDFELAVTYTLEKKSIHVKWEVKNAGEETMHFTIGGHPAFRFAAEGEGKGDYVLRFPGKDALNYILIDMEEASADPSKVYKLQLSGECCPLSEEMFENDALIFDGGQIEEVWLCRKDGSPYVGMKCGGFPNFGIWSVKNAPFVCLEPWMGRCDDVGFVGDISEKPNINKVAPGEVFEQSYTIIAGE